MCVCVRLVARVVGCECVQLCARVIVFVCGVVRVIGRLCVRFVLLFAVVCVCVGVRLHVWLRVLSV